MNETKNYPDTTPDSYTYQITFNFFRPNSYKWGKTSLKILNESNTAIDPAVLSLPPIILDYHAMLYLRKLNPFAGADRYRENLIGGYHVPDSPVSLKYFGVYTHIVCRNLEVDYGKLAFLLWM